MFNFATAAYSVFLSGEELHVHWGNEAVGLVRSNRVNNCVKTDLCTYSYSVPMSGVTGTCMLVCAGVKKTN